MNEVVITVVGNVVSDVRLHRTSKGEAVTSFRIASNARRFDRNADRWVDAEASYYSVSCWRGLAHNVSESVSKGMPVIVTGRLRQRTIDRAVGDHTVRQTFDDIQATAVGPDLARGVTTFERTKRPAVVRTEERAVADAMAVIGRAPDDAADPADGSADGSADVDDRRTRDADGQLRQSA